MHIKKNIKGKKNSNEKYNRWLGIMVVKEGEKKKERKRILLLRYKTFKFK